MNEAQQEISQQDTALKCQWRIDDDWQEDTVYKTTCGHLYQFADCDMSESEFKYCPYCGLAIEES